MGLKGTDSGVLGSNATQPTAAIDASTGELFSASVIGAMPIRYPRDEDNDVRVCACARACVCVCAPPFNVCVCVRAYVCRVCVSCVAL